MWGGGGEKKIASDVFKNKIKFDEIMGTILWIQIFKRGGKMKAPVPEKQKIIFWEIGKVLLGRLGHQWLELSCKL